MEVGPSMVIRSHCRFLEWLGLEIEGPHLTTRQVGLPPDGADSSGSLKRYAA